jgi:hypothetical protein
MYYGLQDAVLIFVFNVDRFSFCQYPFVLSIAAKRSILQKDSEQQMIVQARVRVSFSILIKKRTKERIQGN